MNKTALNSPRESVSLIAAFFCSVYDNFAQDSTGNYPVILSVREDICFGDGWLRLGEIALKPAPKEKDEDELTLAKDAVRHGFYEWKMTEYDTLMTDCLALMKLNAEGGEKSQSNGNEKAKDKTRRALHSIIDVALRLGLLFPEFDVDVLEAMPFSRPTTVIADTNAVGKGGVDFLINFLYPAARLKVPAIAAMEIVNQSDNFFSKRRRGLINQIKDKQKPDILLDHVISQSGQRAMLRFELHSDIEVDRTPLFSDPLRNAFTQDKNQDWQGQELNLSTPVKSYCDRLILETVRQHLTTVATGHPVMLMTGDEALARMTLSEGMRPLFFHVGNSPNQFGKVLTGTRFHPFTGEAFSIPLQFLLWELSVTFGNARIANKDGSVFFEVRAIDKDLNWQPFHAKDDLLRVSWDGFDHPHKLKQQPTIDFAAANSKIEDKGKPLVPESVNQEAAFDKKQKQTSKLPPAVGSFGPHTVYRFNLNVLMDFIPALLEKVTVTATCEGTPLQEKKIKRKTISRYIGFLMTGQFITKAENGIQATDSLQKLWDAISARDLQGACQLFREIPSLNEFFNRIEKERRIEIDPKAPERNRPSPAYIQIAELCGHTLQIPHDAIYGTFNNPSVHEFVDAAFKAYEKNLKGEDYVLTGLWLETLAIEFGIHPIKARDRLSEAHAAGMLERFTQGSTPDTRFENHTLTVLQIQEGRPVLKKVCLYHGDFIIPGKASVSIRLEKKINYGTTR